MIRTNLRRSAAVVAASTLAATTLAAVGATTTSANAATTTTIGTKVDFTSSWNKVAYGERANFVGYVNTTGGESKYPRDDDDNHHIYLQRSVGGAFTTIYRAELDMLSEHWNGVVHRNAKYRFCYTGGRSVDYLGNVVNYAPSCSISRSLNVTFNVQAKMWTGRRTWGYTGTVSPKVTKKVKLQTQRGKRWVTVRTFKLTKGKRFNVKTSHLSGRSRLVIPGTAKNVKTISRTLY